MSDSTRPSSEVAERATSESDLWEYKLAVDTLRAEMSPILQRWGALKRGLYSKSITRIARKDSLQWMQDRLAEVERMTGSLMALANHEFTRAWGEPGEPGDANLIVQTSRLWAEMCANALAWEEAVRFTSVDSIFEPVRELFVGVAGRLIDEAEKLPKFLEGVVSDPEASGTHTLDMVLTLPDEWSEQVSLALQEAADDFVNNPG